MGLRLIRALPGERPFLVTVAVPAQAGRIDARVAAPGPHDFAVRQRRFAQVNGSPERQPAAIASRAQRSVTMRIAPLRGAGRECITKIGILVKRNILV